MDDREKCAKAKEALELTDTGLLSGSEERVQVRAAPAGGRAQAPRADLAPSPAVPKALAGSKVAPLPEYNCSAVLDRRWP